MKIRLMGTPDECTATVRVLRACPGLDVIEVGEPRPNRGDSRQVRVYIETRTTPAQGAPS